MLVLARKGLALFGHVWYSKLQLQLKLWIPQTQATEQCDVDCGDIHAGSPDAFLVQAHF